MMLALQLFDTLFDSYLTVTVKPNKEGVRVANIIILKINFMANEMTFPSYVELTYYLIFKVLRTEKRKQKND